jgi:hypothetical protein
MRDIIARIANSIEGLLNSEVFNTWLRGEGPQRGDVIVLNNHYIARREFATKPSPFHLMLTIGERGEPDRIPDVIKDFALRSEFKLVRRNSANLPTPTGLPEAIERELGEFGRLPLILLGTVRDDIRLSVPMHYGAFAEVVVDPKAATPVAIEGPRGSGERRLRCRLHMGSGCR